MTAVAEPVPLYVRDGSRFVLYDDRLQHTPPIPVPVVVNESEPSAERPVVEVSPGHFRVYAPRCPHGSFQRWAVRNCCRPPGTPAPRRRGSRSPAPS